MKRILLALTVLGVLGGSYGFYLFNKPVSDVGGKKVEVEIDATTLVNVYKSNEDKANKAYFQSGDAVIEWWSRPSNRKKQTRKNETGGVPKRNQVGKRGPLGTKITELKPKMIKIFQWAAYRRDTQKTLQRRGELQGVRVAELKPKRIKINFHNGNAVIELRASLNKYTEVPMRKCDEGI